MNTETGIKFVFVRHGETDWNREKRIQGQSGTGLNSKGEEDMRKLARSLSSLEITRIVASDLLRAVQTADIIARELNLFYALDARLRECAFGSLEGRLRSETEELYGAPWPADHDPYDFIRFGGESRTQVLERHLALVRELAAEQPNGAIALVGHGRALTTLWNIFEPGVTIPRGEYRILEASAVL